MYLFIAIIFIAELIIAFTLISFTVKADRKVCALNKRVVECKPVIHKCLISVKDTVKNLQKTFDNCICIVRRKRQQFTMKIIIAAVMYISLFLFKGKYKKAGTFFRLAVLIKDYWDSLPVWLVNCKKICYNQIRKTRLCYE